jgi:acetyltransferase
MLTALRREIPALRQHGPILDLLGDASPADFAAACRRLLAAPGNDALLVLFTPQQRSDPLACAEAVIAAVGERQRRPVLACWMGEGLVAAARERLAQAGVLHFSSPERCLDAFSYLAAYERNQLALMQAPPPQPVQLPADVAGARLIIEEALSHRRHALGAAEATAVLSAFRIPVLHSLTVHSASEALVAAETLGLPVTLHVDSIAGPVADSTLSRDVRDAPTVRTAYLDLQAQLQSEYPDEGQAVIAVRRLRDRPEQLVLKLSVLVDADFGPTLRLATQTAAAEGALALPPLNLFLARDLVARALGDAALALPRDSQQEMALLEVLMRVSEMCCVLPELQHLQIEPLEVSADGVCAGSVAVQVSPRRATTRRYGHMAIHPYPAAMETRWQLPDGRDVTIRPMKPEDAALEQAFVEGLSPDSRYNRFMYRLEKLTPSMLARFTQIDYDREMALAVFLQERGADVRQLAVARYVTNPDGQSCEFALTVADDMQGQGVGRQLMQGLMDAARDRGLEVMEGEVLASNRRMLKLCEGLGFRLLQGGEDPELVSVRLYL